MQEDLNNIMDQSANAHLMSREAPDPAVQRAALVSHWNGVVVQAREFWTKRAFNRMKSDMAFAAGRQWSDDVNDQYVDEASERYVANVVLRHVQSRTAAIYGKNPKIVARRKRRLMSSVWDGNMQTIMQAQQLLQADPMNAFAQATIAEAQEVFEYNRRMDRVAETLQVLFEHELAEQSVPFKVQMKATVRRGLTTGVGYVKLGYQRVMKHSPDVESRMQDVSQRLATLERLSADLADGEADPNAMEAEQLRLTLQSLSNDKDVVAREGLLLSYPDSTSIIPDTGMKQLRGFLGCNWVAEEYYMTADAIKETYKVDPGNAGAKVYHEKGDGSVVGLRDGEEPSNKNELFCVWEIYNKTDGMVYAVCDGYKDFLVEPSSPDVYLERFWPWFAFVVNEVYDDLSVFPPSDVHLMRDMQMELNRSRQGLREHRRANRPKYVTRTGALEEGDKEKLANCKAHEVVELQGLNPNENVHDVLQYFSNPVVDQSLYDTRPSYDDYLRVLGQHEASLGGTSGATATEVATAEGARATTSSAVVDDLDEFLEELARAGGQVLMLEASPEKVKEVVGPGAFWPQLSRAEAAKEIYLDVEAASTGRPNQAQQVQAAQQIFPLLLQIPGVSPEWAAKELIRRLDDKADLTDAFAASMPSVMMMNRTPAGAGGQPATTADAPQNQGAEGANNAPSTAAPQVNTAPRPGAGQAQMNPV